MLSEWKASGLNTLLCIDGKHLLLPSACVFRVTDSSDFAWRYGGHGCLKAGGAHVSLGISQIQNKLAATNQAHQGPSGSLERRAFNRRQTTRRGHLLTVDSPESLGCDYPTLVSHESVQPLPCRILYPEKIFLTNLVAIALSNQSYDTSPR